MIVSAPGKLILWGEYAVLEGAPAVVMAVNRRAVCRVGEAPEAPLIRAVRERAQEEFSVAVPPLRVESGAFTEGGRKLGIGSSAAATVAAAGFVARGASADLAAAAVRARLWRVAHAAHDAFQGTPGSGLDLAAALYGGVLAMTPGSPPTFAAFPWPANLRLSFYWTGVAASTGALVGAVKAWAAREPVAYAERIAALTTEARALLEPLADASRLARLDAYGRAEAALGEAAGVPIVTEAMRELAHAARELGGVAKPSGAGGGDCVLACFASALGEAAFAERAAACGFSRLLVTPEPYGVREEM